MEVKPAEIEQAMAHVAAKDLATLRLAAKRIAAFHRRQLQKSWQYRDPIGMLLGQRITPLERVGVYVPGGKASYPSTVLMNAVPAKVAGVKEIIMTSPIGNDGAIILAAAQDCRRRPHFSRRRRAGDRRAGLWHRRRFRKWIKSSAREISSSRRPNAWSSAKWISTPSPGPVRFFLLADDSAPIRVCRCRHAFPGGAR